MSKLGALLLPVAALWSCSIDFRHVPAPLKIERAKIFGSERTIFLRKFEINRQKDKLFEEYYRRSLLSFVLSANEGLVPGNSESADIVLDVILDARFRENQFWWLNWLAILPFPLVWPLQRRSVKTEISLFICASEKNGRINSRKFLEEEDLSIYFYGFFRTAYFERGIKSSYSSLFKKSGNWLRSVLKEDGPGGPAQLPVLIH